MSMIMDRPGQADTTAYERKVLGIARGLRFTASQISTSVHDIVFALISVVSPLPSAIGICLALHHNDVSWWVSVPLALAVEVGGIAAVSIALRAWMASRSGQDVDLPRWMPVFLVLAYLLVVEGIVISNEAGPALSRVFSGESPFLAEMHHVAPVLYVFVTAIGAIVGVLEVVINDHDQRARALVAQQDTIAAEREQIRLDAERERMQDEVDAEREQRQLAMEMQRQEHAAKLDAQRLRLEAKLSKGSVNGSVKLSVKDATADASTLSGDDIKRRIFDRVVDVGYSGPTDVANYAGVTRQTADKYLKEMVDDGTLRRVESSHARRKFDYVPVQKVTPMG